MDSRLANDIINQLQAKRYELEWTQFNSTNADIGEFTCVVIGNDVHPVTPIQSYTTVVAFFHWDTATFVEVGKYSRTTSRQVTQIYNRDYSDFKRVYFNKIR